MLCGVMDGQPLFLTEVTLVVRSVTAGLGPMLCCGALMCFLMYRNGILQTWSSENCLTFPKLGKSTWGAVYQTQAGP